MSDDVSQPIDLRPRARQFLVRLAQRTGQTLLQVSPLVVVSILAYAAAQPRFIQFLSTECPLTLHVDGSLLQLVKLPLHRLAVSSQPADDVVQALLIVRPHPAVGLRGRFRLLRLEPLEPGLVLLTVPEKLIYFTRNIIRHLASPRIRRRPGLVVRSASEDGPAVHDRHHHPAHQFLSGEWSVTAQAVEPFRPANPAFLGIKHHNVRR